MGKVIVTCALTGAQQGKEKNPNLPVQPDEIIAQGLNAWRAGAAILHIHARDAEGRPTCDVKVFERIVAGLRQEGCDAVLNLTTGGAVAGLPLEQRLRVVAELRPEIASFSVGGGSLLGRYDVGRGEWVGDRFVSLFSSYRELERVARLFSDSGTRPELEVYHSGMVNNIEMLLECGALEGPLWVNLVTGIPGECNRADLRELAFLSERLPQGSLWLASMIGARNHFRLLAAVAALGGHVRVGLEDNVYIERGELASGNGQLVERAVSILELSGFEIAGPAQVRQMLNLQTTNGGSDDS